MPENQGTLWRYEGAEEKEKAAKKLIFVGF
jgi:hypothetical protein